MPRILFICNQMDETPTYGGAIATKGHYDMLVKLFGHENVDVIAFGTIPNKLDDPALEKKYNPIRRKLNRLFYGHALLSPEKIHYIARKAVRYSLIWIDESLLGPLAQIIHEQHPTIPIISFFQNIEYDYARQVRIKTKILIGKWVVLKSADRNERATVRYSDKVITLNKRDATRLKELYRREADFILPICLHDRFISPVERKAGNTAAFIGSYFTPNVNGLKWFVKNVLPFVDIRLLIGGRAMADLPRSFHEDPKIEIHSDLPCLNEIYGKADFIVSPILEGSGMKVKTCEALMYGKTIFGTREALEGYEINENIGRECNSPKEFIDTINHYLQQKDRSSFNPHSRQLYLNAYSQESVLPKLRIFLQQTLADFGTDKKAPPASIS